MTGKDEDTGAFKTPTLRDVSKRGPYMHDGSVATLREAVELYDRGGVKNPWLSVEVKPLHLTPNEIDALVAVWLGITEEQLEAIYPARYPVLGDYEDVTWFDATGRKIAGDWRVFGTGQTKEHWEQFRAYLEDPAKNLPPDGYTPPFYKADRIAEYRQAHAAFTERMKEAAS